MRPRFATGKNWRFKRLNSNNFYLRVPLFEYLANTGYRAASTYAADKKINCSIGILPYLFSRGFAVDLRIGRV